MKINSIDPRYLRSRIHAYCSGSDWILVDTIHRFLFLISEFTLRADGSFVLESSPLFCIHYSVKEVTIVTCQKWWEKISLWTFISSSDSKQKERLIMNYFNDIVFFFNQSLPVRHFMFEYQNDHLLRDMVSKEKNTHKKRCYIKNISFSWKF